MKISRRAGALAAGALALVLSTVALATQPIPYEDASGVLHNLAAEPYGSNFMFDSAPNTNGAPVSTANPMPVQVVGGSSSSSSLAAATSGGSSVWAATGGTGNALLTNSAVAAKNAAGTFYGITVVNPNATVAYVQVFDAAPGSVTLGTTPPKMFFWVPAGGAWEEKFATYGVAFSSGITVAATTTATGNTAPSTGLQAQLYLQ